MLTYINKYNLWCWDDGERYHFTLVYTGEQRRTIHNGVQCVDQQRVTSAGWPRGIVCRRQDAWTFYADEFAKGTSGDLYNAYNARLWTASDCEKCEYTRVNNNEKRRASYIVCVEIMSGRECLMLSRVINWLRGMWIKRNHSSAFLFRCEERDYCKCVG